MAFGGVSAKLDQNTHLPAALSILLSISPYLSSGSLRREPPWIFMHDSGPRSPASDN
jgi:hypothetical protein